MRRRDHQSGFSIVEALIVLIAIGLISTAGWLIYQHNRTKLTNAAAGSTPQTNQQTTTTTPIAKTLDIKEWGVHMTLDSSTASLYYYIGPQTPDVAYLSLKTVSDVAPDCAANKVSLAAIGRLTEAEQQAIVSGSTPGNAGTIHIGSYWYNYQNSHVSCMTDTATQQAVAKAQPSFNLQSIFKTLAAD